ncbi:MAG TPA: ATP-binding protein [Polyangiaceae bacterium]|nr:ATP-binding protein [Polyangiaceae bacterium]
MDPAAANQTERADGLAQNARDLALEIAWLTELIDTRFKLYFESACSRQSVLELTPPDLSAATSPYARFLRDYRLEFTERVALVLSLVQHLKPQLLDVFFTRNTTFDRPFTEFGGARSEHEGGFMPTLATLAFLVAGDELEGRFAVQALFEDDHPLLKHDILRLRSPGDGASRLNARLDLSEEAWQRFTTGRAHRAAFGADFPARFVDTALGWDDLVLHPGTRRQVDEIAAWIRHGDTLLHEWGMGRKARPGYRSLFYGPPGTGKTMTACLLGKSTGRDVYKVDLSLVVSKYIGETEKNLAKVFDRAQYRGWILFFDEADALFGKRSETRDSHDRYANQEVAFLLQRIETFDGVAILASNQRDNLDTAFSRRFESIIYFPTPRPEERLRLWTEGLSSKARWAPELDLPAIAREHELSGGAIMSVIRYASLQALDRASNTITLEDVQQGIRRELAKEGKLG